jgi:hypothetical protein
MKEIYATDPNVVPITLDLLVRFEKALKFEISEREAIQKSKPTKTPEEYQACSGGVVMSPEGMKLADDFAQKNANAPVDEMMKAQQKMNEQMLALLMKNCGEDPRQWANNLVARLKEAEGKASNIAMPEGWLPRSTGLRVPTLSSTWGSDAGDIEARIDSTVVLYPFRRHYAGLKEGVAGFCVSLGEEWQVQAGTAGVRLKTPSPDTGKGKSIVAYSSAEAEAMKSRCIAIIPLLKFLEKMVFPNPFQ